MFTANYVTRYFYMICFQSYLKGLPTNFTLETVTKYSFSNWLHQRPELVSGLSRAL